MSTGDRRQDRGVRPSTLGGRTPRALFPAPSRLDGRPTVGVLALQGDVREHSLALEAAGARAVGVRSARDLGSAPGERLDGIIIPGGESTTMSTLLSAFGMLRPLRGLIAAGLPAYGSCAGMIMLADRVEGAEEGQAFLGGIRMTVRRNAFGRQVDSYEEDLVAPALGADEGHPLRAVFIRAPWVEEVGPGVEILATTRAGRAGDDAPGSGGRIVAVRQGRMLATAFHPEVGGDHRVHDIFVGMVGEAACDR
ncbi:pyridoxal 5'-phosphate synthase subunit PdxT [Actinomyces capricornis]|uniref:Pyridoxal 5'-phosphate synthase subunit PdxT n=1 Tax=Actinomyces capricornis TaxID=2755559 RepID=A0ABM7UEB9_9ACTO|nr:pyridoxal 5'-phosphate synthase subunit PdxT [Actinomyces capricornis]